MTAPQFVVRLDDYLNRWMNLAKVSPDFKGLKDLFSREQFVQSCSQHLQVFLKERKVKSVYEMVEIAEQYNEAHSSYDSSQMIHVQSVGCDIWRSRQDLANISYWLKIHCFRSVMEGFIESGKALGLEGEALTIFVEAKEADRIEREEKKEKERLERDERREAEKLAREEKEEAEKLAREAKSEAQRLEREERAKDRELKLAGSQAIEKIKRENITYQNMKLK